jgi:hypothetical protein
MGGTVPGIISRRAVRLSLLLLACLLTLLCWERSQLSNGFSLVVSDWLDGRIQASIIAHWYNVFRGLESWNSTAFFYPWSGTLGYNDGYFLYGVVASVFRHFGVDPFLSVDLTNLVIRGIGFLACYLFAVDVVALGFGWATLASAIFTLANNAYVQQGHSQLLSVSFAPLLGWLIWRALQALRARANTPAILWGCAAALLFGAWLLSAFYTAWFMTLFVVLVILSAALSQAINAGEWWRAWRFVIAWPLLPVGAAAVLCTLPFLIVYLPKVQETGGHQFAEALAYTPNLFDLVHVGSDNLLFGGLDRWVIKTFYPSYPDYGEGTIGFPPVLAILALAGAVLGLRGMGKRALLWRPIAIATIVSFALFVHLGHHTLWYLVYHGFPGASGVRVVSRYAIFLAFPLTLLAVAFLASRAKRWPRWVTLICTCVLLLEEITTVNPAGLDRAAEMRLVNSIQTPPATCRAFAIQVPFGRPSIGVPILDSLYPHNVDAMIIGEVLALPTVNGFSTFLPPDWVFQSIDQPDYVSRVGHYLQSHDLREGVCGLDLAKGIWSTQFGLPAADVLSNARLKSEQAAAGGPANSAR